MFILLVFDFTGHPILCASNFDGSFNPRVPVVARSECLVIPVSGP
jgi:hypothetical protein